MIYSPEAILNHLKVYLPQATNLFTGEATVSGIIVAGTPQTLRVTKTGHGKAIGQSVTFANSSLDNGISVVSDFVDNGTAILKFTTNVKHDLTFGYEDNLTGGQIELRGFTNSALNGFFDLRDVPSSTTFEIVSPVTPPVALNGNEVLREYREVGVNNIFEVSAVPDANTFDIELTGLPEFDTLTVNNLVEIESYRMSIVSTWERVEEIYTKQAPTIPWLYLIMENVIASKDRTIQSDAVATNTTQNPTRVRNIGQFSINIIYPTTNELTGANAVQLSYKTIYPILLAVMSGVKLETFDTTFLTTLIGHGMVRYNRAYYAHNYTFECVYDVTYENTFLGNYNKTVPFRRINIKFAEEQDGSNIILYEEE